VYYIVEHGHRLTITVRLGDEVKQALGKGVGQRGDSPAIGCVGVLYSTISPERLTRLMALRPA
jgi:hypothetical protein